MPISLDCPCGKALRVQDHLAGKKVKCPVCGEILDVPSVPATREKEDVVFDEIAPEPRPSKSLATTSSTSVRKSRTDELSVSGKAASSSFGHVLVPSMFGTTSLTLRGDRLVDDTKKIVASHHTEILLNRLDSAEIVVGGNNAFLAIGVMSLMIGLPLIPVLVGIPIAMLGLVFFALYFFMKNRFLVIRSGSNAAVLVIKGPDEEFQEFLDAVLTAAAAHSER